MRRSTLRVRVARVLGSGALVVAGLLLPGAAPAAAADPLILRVGLTQTSIRSTRTRPRSSSGYEAFQLNYDLLVDFGPEAGACPRVRRSLGACRRRPFLDVPYSGRHDLVRRKPATSEDACFSLPAQHSTPSRRGENIGLGYLDPGVDDAGVTKAECPDDQTMILTRATGRNGPPDLRADPPQAHLGREDATRTIADAQFDAAARRDRVRTRRGVADRPVRPVRAQSELLGQAGRRRRGRHPVIFGTADTMVQALKAGELDYARGFNADQFNALKTDPNITRSSEAPNGWTELGFNTYGTGTDKTIDGGGPSTPALLDPAFRDALGYAIDNQDARRPDRSVATARSAPRRSRRS